MLSKQKLKIQLFLQKIIGQKYLILTGILSVLFFVILIFCLRVDYHFNEYKSQQKFFDQANSILSSNTGNLESEISKLQNSNFASKNGLSIASKDLVIGYLLSSSDDLAKVKAGYLKLEDSIEKFENELLLADDYDTATKLYQNIQTTREIIIDVSVKLCFGGLREMINILDKSIKSINQLAHIINLQISELTKLKIKYGSDQVLNDCLVVMSSTQKNLKNGILNSKKLLNKQVSNLNENMQSKINNLALCLNTKALYLSEDSKSNLQSGFDENINTQNQLLSILQSITSTGDLEYMCNLQSKQDGQNSSGNSQNNSNNPNSTGNQADSDPNATDKGQNSDDNTSGPTDIKDILQKLSKIANDMQQQNSEDKLQKKQSGQNKSGGGSRGSGDSEKELKSQFDVNNIEKGGKSRYENVQNSKIYGRRSLDYLNELFDEFWGYDGDYKSGR